MKKKILAIAVISAMIMGCTACGTSTDPVNETNGTELETDISAEDVETDTESKAETEMSTDEKSNGKEETEKTTDEKSDSKEVDKIVDKTDKSEDKTTDKSADKKTETTSKSDNSTAKNNSSSTNKNTGSTGNKNTDSNTGNKNNSSSNSGSAGNKNSGSSNNSNNSNSGSSNNNNSSNSGSNNSKPSEPTTKPAEPTKPAHKHSYSASVTKNATCNSTGEKTYKCACGDSYTESIPATGSHNWQHHDEVGHYETVVIKEASKEPIYESITYCNDCGKAFKGPNQAEEAADHGMFECDGPTGSYRTEEKVVGYKDIPAVTEQRWVVDQKAYDSCTVCGAKK